MNETYVTLNGWVGNDVQFRTPQGISVATFRVGVTPRVKRGGSWQDGETAWINVTVWRALAEHVRDSVHKGEAVIVHGRLRTESWTREDGQRSTSLEVEATLVGHDLNRGTSAFLKVARQSPTVQDGEMERELAEMRRHATESAPAALDSWGEPVVERPVAVPTGQDDAEPADETAA